MKDTVTRDELARQLDNEAHLAAAEAIRCGEDPQAVLRGLAGAAPRYDDGLSRNAHALFEDVVAGITEVVS